MHYSQPGKTLLYIMLVILVAIILLIPMVYRSPEVNQQIVKDISDSTPSEIIVEQKSTQEIALKMLSDQNRKRLKQGCFGKDCIPSIDNPNFLPVAEVDFLEPEEMVISLVMDGTAKAYPLKILNWHEIVNDEVNGEPVLITFCPLCYTGIAFQRVLDGEPVEFGVSGKLLNNNLVMYDRKTESYWEQLTGKAIVGPKTGEKLEFINVWTVSWADFQEDHPEGLVLAIPQGSQRDYNYYPYGDYQTSERVLFENEHEDNRLHRKEIVYGLIVNGQAKAYPEELIQEQLAEGGTILDSLGGADLQITYQNGKFTPVNLQNNQQIDFQIGFFFAWAAFHPQTDIYQQP